jgi:hypothetical protein
VILDVGATEVLDRVSCADWAATKWYVALSTEDRTSMSAVEIYAIHHRGTNPLHNTYSMQGDPFDYGIEVTVVGGFLQLEITNSSTAYIVAYGSRISIPYAAQMQFDSTGVVVTDTHKAVLAGTSIVLDEFEYWRTHAVKWMVSISDARDNRTSSQIFAMMKTGLLSSAVEYATLGDLSIDYDLSVLDHNNTVQLILTNNEAEPVFVDATQMPVITDMSRIYTPVESNTHIITPVATTISPTASAIVDSQVPVPGHTACKWLVHIENSTNVTSGGFELYANRQRLTNISHDVYSTLGTWYDILITASVIGNNMTLSITNNEAVPLTVRVLHIPITI